MSPTPPRNARRRRPLEAFARPNPTRNLATRNLATRNLATRNLATRDLATLDLATLDLATLDRTGPNRAAVPGRGDRNGPVPESPGLSLENSAHPARYPSPLPPR